MHTIADNDFWQVYIGPIDRELSFGNAKEREGGEVMIASPAGI